MEHSIEFRVAYYETDAQGRVHHGTYIDYFERGRVELLRSRGYSYRQFEADGLLLVVSEMQLKYLGAAEFDDLLRLTTRVVRARGVRIEHAYAIHRLDQDTGEPREPIVTASSTIACVDRRGKVRPLPAYMRQLR